ncbi:Imm1 family immunity protein [Streptomyces sp. NPDC051771]|uniref:Imm1 family immunity protein n=1 Tax=Streptomyces sp. NPDC051771 TaxID=3154847 RepID=UPI00341AED48
MILNVFINGQTYYSAEWPVVERVLGDLFGALGEDEGSSVEPKKERVTAEFTLSVNRANGIRAAQNFDSYLHAAVNQQTGYGALMWLLTPGSSLSVEVATAAHVWISDNLTPPDVDPYVISDSDLSRYHHPHSTLPASAVRAAVEDFCRAGTGMRPSCIEWTPGDLSGRRLDVPDVKVSIAYCDDPWCEISEPNHPCH